MYKVRIKVLLALTGICSVLLFILFTTVLVPSDGLPFLFNLAVAFVAFLVFQFLANYAYNTYAEKIRQNSLFTKETDLLSSFISKIRFAYSLDDLFEAIRTELEDRADCSVLYMDKKNNYVVYNSPDRIVSAQQTLQTLEMNFKKNTADGVYFFDDELGVTSAQKKSRGFFLVHENHHFYVLCRYTRLFDPVIFSQLYDEFVSFTNRSSIITDLTRISELSKEWNMVAETQRSFLPAVMPQVKHLDIAAYFRPLVNVSGDYYSVLPINEDKTLFLLGDVSGKGLAAALVMGIVINTVKNIQNKEDLPNMIKAVDAAIKGMKFDDKYTVMFLGIVDTAAMTITYVNASMSDPIIITKTPAGFNIKPLESSCSLVGIIELDDIRVETKKLFYDDMILIATDGVSEVMNDEGIELGDTELYKQTVQNSAFKSAQHFVNDISDLVLEYNGNKKLRDDVTMLAVKIER
ncbi:MAG: SpoIIE family protein phosphatase [Spirochaetaceae bacterium]|nr:SpoIIE family protein phosphatase [Spirochaetaceae bacterium]MBP5328450.1 SpoIIE family protein phosphatase [Spirochaetaceae bacterium]